MHAAEEEGEGEGRGRGGGRGGEGVGEGDSLHTVVLVPVPVCWYEDQVSHSLRCAAFTARVLQSRTAHLP